MRNRIERCFKEYENQRNSFWLLNYSFFNKKVDLISEKPGIPPTNMNWLEKIYKKGLNKMEMFF